ncbi:elongin A, like isoform X2 [Amia ocellicauda]
MKTLKRLQDLEITLEILAETGIGKTVNGFRKHDVAGEAAKALVNQWKKLVPKDTNSLAQNGDFSESQSCNMKAKEEFQAENGKSSRMSGGKHSAGDVARSEKSDSEKKKHGRGVKSPKTRELKSCDSQDYIPSKKHYPDNDKVEDPKMFPESFKNERCLGSTKLSQQSSRMSESEQPSNGDKSKSKHECKRSTTVLVSEEESSPTKSFLKDKKSAKISKEDHAEVKKLSKEKVKSSGNAVKQKGANGKKDTLNRMKRVSEKDQSGEDSETPAMSFESYLSYDLKSPKRKRRSTSDTKSAKKPKSDRHQCENSVKKTPATKPVKKNSAFEEPIKTVKTGSVMDLLNVPLPAFLPDCSDFSMFPSTENKAKEVVSNLGEEPPVFTGQRLNTKMQVYSGTKTAFLPTMMTLYQQCIRTLQNNIDLLYDIGGVPFEILEPVLERCTPEQLLRIEECNPVYIGETDHLWVIHCKKDFRNEELEEYESWREMYIRLFEEREKKLKLLTKSIVSAHSGKPKGRQVKLAFINSVAKPPRDVRRQQEIHGTARSLGQHPTLDKSSIKSSDKPRSSLQDSLKLNSDYSTPSNASTSQDPKKFIKRVAPMMAKSLKAFKSRLGRR